jgi:hypothetical protein
MTDDGKQQAWRRLCSELEALCVDPDDPQVPPDDPRHPQVQAALTEYKVAIGEIVPVPPRWEGSPPLRPITSLADLAAWLNDQWNSTLATEMGGERYRADALEQATRAVRNGFRVLVSLGVEHRPERPLRPDTLAVAKQQFDDLERWVRQKIKDGWTLPKPSKPDEASPATKAKRRKRGEFPDEYEVNVLVHRYLSQNPRAGIRKVAEALGFSVGTVQKTEAWRQKVKRRKAEKPPQIKAVQLRRTMLEGVPNYDSMEAVDDRIDQREATWRRIIEEATLPERARLNKMSEDDKQALIDEAEEQNADMKEQEKRRRWQRRERS